MVPRGTFRAVVTAALCLGGSVSFADQLTYRPVNPSFGGDPFNSSHLYQGAEIANTFDDDDFDLLLGESTAAELFKDSLQSSIIAGAATQITNSIYTTGAPTSGVFTLDGATVSYETVGDRVQVTINDGITSQVLDIPKPTVSP